MDKPGFVYVTYIATTPERLWRALLEPEFTKRYWRHVNVSDWKVGSRWEHRRDGAHGQLDLVGRVVKVQRPRRLVVTWADPKDEGRKSAHSRVTYAIDPYRKGVVRLTVTHDGLKPGSAMDRGIRFGWPVVLSSLKTLLERGKALPKFWDRKE